MTAQPSINTYVLLQGIGGVVGVMFGFSILDASAALLTPFFGLTDPSFIPIHSPSPRVHPKSAMTSC